MRKIILYKTTLVKRNLRCKKVKVNCMKYLTQNAYIGNIPRLLYEWGLLKAET